MDVDTDYPLGITSSILPVNLSPADIAALDLVVHNKFYVVLFEAPISYGPYTFTPDPVTKYYTGWDQYTNFLYGWGTELIRKTNTVALNFIDYTKIIIPALATTVGSKCGGLSWDHLQETIFYYILFNDPSAIIELSSDKGLATEIVNRRQEIVDYAFNQKKIQLSETNYYDDEYIDDDTRAWLNYFGIPIKDASTRPPAPPSPPPPKLEDITAWYFPFSVVGDDVFVDTHAAKIELGEDLNSIIIKYVDYNYYNMNEITQLDFTKLIGNPIRLRFSNTAHLDVIREGLAQGKWVMCTEDLLTAFHHVKGAVITNRYKPVRDNMSLLPDGSVLLRNINFLSAQTIFVFDKKWGDLYFPRTRLLKIDTADFYNNSTDPYPGSEI